MRKCLEMNHCFRRSRKVNVASDQAPDLCALLPLIPLRARLAARALRPYRALESLGALLALYRQEGTFLVRRAPCCSKVHAKVHGISSTLLPRIPGGPEAPGGPGGAT